MSTLHTSVHPVIGNLRVNRIRLITRYHSLRSKAHEYQTRVVQRLAEHGVPLGLVSSEIPGEEPPRASGVERLDGGPPAEPGVLDEPHRRVEVHDPYRAARLFLY